MKTNEEPSNHQVESSGMSALRAAQQAAQQMHSGSTPLRDDENIKPDDDQILQESPLMHGDGERIPPVIRGGEGTVNIAAHRASIAPYHPLVTHLVQLLRRADCIDYAIVVNDEWDTEFYPTYGRVIDLLLDADLAYPESRLAEPHQKLADQIDAAISQIKSETDERFALIWAFVEDRFVRIHSQGYRDDRTALSAPYGGS